MREEEYQPHAPLPTQSSPRCGAKTRKDTPCKGPCVKRPNGEYKSRCRMHGGAAGSGAVAGNSSAFRHGFYTAEAKAQRKELQEFLITAAAMLSEITDTISFGGNHGNPNS